MKPWKSIFRKFRKKEDTPQEKTSLATIKFQKLFEKEDPVDLPFPDLDMRRTWLRFRRDMKEERLVLISNPSLETNKITRNSKTPKNNNKSTNRISVKKNDKLVVPYEVLSVYSPKEIDFFRIFLQEFCGRYDCFYPDKNTDLKQVFQKGFFLSTSFTKFTPAKSTQNGGKIKESQNPYDRIKMNEERKNPQLGHPNEVLKCLNHFFELECDKAITYLEGTSIDKKFTNPFTFKKLYRALEISTRSYHNRLIYLNKMSFLIKKVFLYTGVLMNLFLEINHVDKAKVKDRYDFMKDQLKMSIQIMSHFTESLDTLQMSPFQKNKELKLQYRDEQKIQCNYLDEFGLTRVILDLLQKLSIIFSTRTDLTFIFSYQEAILHIAQSLINCSPTKIVDHFTSGGGMQELLNCLNWPIELILIVSSKEDWEDIDLYNVLENETRVSNSIDNNKNRIRLYFDLQLLVLHIIFQTLSRGRIYVEKFCKLNGWNKVASMGVWVSFFLSRIKKIGENVKTLKLNKTKFPPLNVSGEPVCPGFIKKMPNEYFFNFFELVEKIVALSPILSNPGRFKKDTNGMYDFSLISDEMKPQKLLVEMYLSFFNDQIDSEKKNDYIKKAREKMKCCTEFQLFFLDNLIKFSTAKDSTVDVLISLGLYGVLFSDYFYFFGGVSNPINALKVNKVMYKKMKDKSKADYAAEISNVLRRSVLAFLSFYALKKDRKNFLEIRQLFDVMMMHQNNSQLVQEISETLLVIMKFNFERSEESLIKMKGFISMISHLIAITDNRKSRNSLIKVMNVMFESKQIHSLALIDRKTIEVLFSLCFMKEKDSELHKKTMLGHIGTLMRNESKGTNFELIVNQFCEMFPKIQDQMCKGKNTHLGKEKNHTLSRKDSKFLILVLQTLQNSLTTSRREILQNEFCRHFDKFLLLANVRSPISHQLCVEIFKTIRFLISKNKKNRSIFSNLTSNYMTLKEIVLNWCPNKHPSKQVFCELFNMLVDGEFNLENKSTIVNPMILVLVFELFKNVSKASYKMINLFLQRFLKIINGNVSNQHSCCEIELISILFDSLDFFHDRFVAIHNHSRDACGILNNLIEVITILGKHSITVKETKSMIYMMKKHARIYELPLFEKLVSSMGKMLKNSPRSFFDCSGNSSGLKIKNDKLWPSYNVYSLSFWVRVEQFTGKKKMMILSFFDKFNSGIEVFFENEYIKVVVSKKERKFASEFVHQFQKDKWTYVVISHSSRALTKHVMKLYVDGCMVSKIQMKYPQVSGEGSTLYIGNDDCENESCFRGQFGFINIFEDLLSLSTIKMIYSLGHNYMSPFHPVDADMFPKETQPLFNSGLSSKLSFCFNSKTGRVVNLKGVIFCDNLSPNKKYRRPDALVMEGTRLCVSQDICDVISGIGGIKAFFPFILTNDEMLMKTAKLKQSSLNSLLTLIIRLLAHSESTREDFLRTYGSVVIAFLLKQISPEHLNGRTCSMIELSFDKLSMDNELLFDFIGNVLCDFRVWIYVRSEYQKVIFQLLLEELHKKKSYFGEFKKVFGVQNFLDKMRFYYWIKKERDYSINTKKIKHPTTHKIIAQRPSKDEIIEIRDILLRIFKRLFSSNTKEFRVELRMLLNFMVTCKDSMQLRDFSKILLEQVLSGNQNSLNLENAFEIFIFLIGSRDEEVRINCIKCLGKFFQVNEKLISLYSVDKINGLDCAYLNLKDYPLTERTYRALRDVFLGTIHLGDNDTDGILEENFRIKAIIPLIFKLILFCDSKNTKLVILRDWREKLKNNPSIKNITLQQANWQFIWMRIISSSFESKSSEDRQIFSVSMDIYSALVFYGLIEHQNGFSTLEKGIATIFHFSKKNNDTDTESELKKDDDDDDDDDLKDDDDDDLKDGVEIEKKINVDIPNEKRKPKQLDFNQILSLLFDRLLRAYIHLESINHRTIRSEKNFVLDNLIYLLSFIENFIFYSDGIRDMMCSIVTNMENSKEGSISSKDFKKRSRSKGGGTPKTQNSNPEETRKKYSRNNSKSFMYNLKSLKFPFVRKNSEASGLNRSFLTKLSPAIDRDVLTSTLGSTSKRKSIKQEDYEKKTIKNYLDRNFDEKEPTFSGLKTLRYTSAIGNWLDLETTKKILHIINIYKFSDISSYSQISQFVSNIFGLRKGGFFRLELKLIKTVFLNSNVSLNDNKYLRELINVNISNIVSVVKKDGEMKKEISKLKDPSIVVSSTENKKLYNNLYRLKLTLATLDAIVSDLISKNNIEIASIVLIEMNKVFMSRKNSVMKHFQDDDKLMRMSLLTGSFVFFLDRSKLKNVTYKDYANFSRLKCWTQVGKLYLDPILRNEKRREISFLKSNVVQRNVYVYFVVKKKINFLKTLNRGMRDVDNVLKCIQTITEVEKQRVLASKQKEEYILTIGSQFWKRTIKNITNDRGIWCNKEALRNRKWMVDPTENKYRMRIKLKRDYSGVDHSNASAAKRRLMSKADEENEKMLEMRRKMRENQLLKLKDQSFSTLKYVLLDESEARMSMKHVQKKLRKESDPSKPDEGMEKLEMDLGEDEGRKEKTLIKGVYCEIVTPMQAYSGTLEITSVKLTWTVDSENKCYAFDKSERVESLEKVPKNKSWLISKIKEIHPRRHQLAQSAIEIFFLNRKNILLNFKRVERNKIFRKLIQTKPRNLELVHKIGSPIENVKRSGITQAWVKGQISNFDYLMKLNTFANRTYNDLSQYPVFPWILSDYTSDKLDLTDPSVYRDLSRPIGALDPSVSKEIQRKFKTLQETGFDDPWMYGSHYSSSAIVNYYLIRIEPYTTFFRILQGGFFDHADRMFDSIPQTWKNCLTSGRDFKELIPEFFYLPEYLTMVNKVDFGTKQSGQKLGEVKLPPWASSAEDFIRKNRAALESDYVSQNLHHWIDLVFGFKQFGEEAIRCNNLYRPFTYEHRVNIDNVENERERLSIISEIQNFGQTPSQLFDSPHPQKKTQFVLNRMEKMFNPLGNEQNIFLKETVTQSKLICSLKVHPGGVCCCISPDGVVCNLKLSTSFTTSFNSNTDLFKENNLKVIKGHSVLMDPRCDKKQMIFGNNFITLKNGTWVISVGHWDNGIKVFKNTNLIQTIGRAHTDFATCIALDEETERFFVTGSMDTNCKVWEIVQNKKIKLKHILYGHDAQITVVAVNSELDVVISASMDNSIIIHTLLSGKFVRSIRHDERVDSLAIYEKGLFVVYSSLTLFLYSINGKFIKSVDTASTVTSILIKSDYLFYCEEKGVILCRNLHDLETIFKYDIKKLGISTLYSLDLYKDFLFAGTGKGRILVIKII